MNETPQTCDHPTCDEIEPDSGWHRRAGTPHQFCSTECNLDYWNTHAETLQGPVTTDEDVSNRARSLADAASDVVGGDADVE